MTSLPFTPIRSLVVRRPIEFLTEILPVFGDTAVMSLEGDLSQCRLDAFEGRLASASPDIAEFPLTAANRERLVDSELSRIGLRKRIAHVRIREAGAIRFASYDWFHPECVGCDASIPLALLDRLVAAGHLAKFADVRPA